MAIGDQEPDIINLVNWEDLYNRDDGDEAIIPGLAYRGRWTAIASEAKAGKSTILLGLAITVAHTPMSVLYLDAEMGRGDVLDRVEDWMQLKPADLKNLHYTDLPPKLDTVQGANRLARTITTTNPDLVIIDGLNGVVNGAENDDTTWRDLYEWAIAPMKQLNVAIISADNLGKNHTLGPRGSSVKLDKADAVINLERTDNGVKLTATHRRTANYPREQYYVVAHASDEGPPLTVTAVTRDAPEGTADMMTLLDHLNAPTDIGIRAARRLIRERGHKAGNAAIDAAVKTRQNRCANEFGTADKPPASEACQTRVSTCSTPLVGHQNVTDSNTPVEDTENPDPNELF